MVASRDPEALSVKKQTAEHFEYQNEHALSHDDEVFLAEFPEEAKTRVLRKVDWRLMPMLLLLYLIAYIDKTNIGIFP
ncbi:MFS transporter [Aspergillus sclerotialis]|uniref:MFS transporter n=1 Tax=Aspergillus sclerotialis TaxID=2070753 RepID=A0A3A2ZTC4_9EURO|nr:MFS transporter [Aspergillus sclerotialis]